VSGVWRNEHGRAGPDPESPIRLRFYMLREQSIVAKCGFSEALMT
jgi:hypothetical protein